jgi:hypothetical protein
MHESMAWNVNRSTDGQWHATRGGGVEDFAFDSMGAAMTFVRRQIAPVQRPRHRGGRSWQRLRRALV